MGITKVHSAKKTIYQLLLLALPTTAVIAFMLFQLNNYYSILKNDWLSQSIYFGIGCVTSIVIHSYRFRFITLGLIIFLINYGIYTFVQSITIGEFDSFYATIKFFLFSVLFCSGWLIGFAFSRSKYLTITWSVVAIIFEIILIGKTSDFTFRSLVNGITPVLIYAFYTIYITELIRNMNEGEKTFIWFIGKRLGLFAVLLLIFFTVILTIFDDNFKTIEKDWAGQSSQQEGKDGESMTQKDSSGGVSNKDQSKLTGSLSKDKQLVFVAHLDNFFEGTNTPNPLYFTSHYYTKFDTETQTFEMDDKMPYNDLFDVDPSKIPLYFKEKSDKVLDNALATVDRKIVTAEIYKVAMAPSSFVAPSTAFYCQPISVPKEFKEQYKSAYSAKMWVSKLNSAYFIYNPAGMRELEQFQEQRFEKLREVEKIVGPDKGFMDYYTFMPKDQEYNRIGDLAKKVTKNAKTPVDKVIAIRDYFLSKDELDQPLFAYSDNPGIPGMPNANKLNYFLFENRKGYCAYFAGATLFMLRSLGIPSRVATGYSTTDRSSKNPGWYWFYQDQAHAWVQVYFQDYGWIDFDTTVPDINTQQAEQPDGTPPTDVPNTYLVIDGNVETVDTIKKTINVTSLKILYHDTEFVAKNKSLLLTDAAIATISNDTGEVRLGALKKNMHVTCISHAEALKEIYIAEKDSFSSIIKKLPIPIPIDEVKIINDEKKKKEEEKKKAKEENDINWLKVLKIVLITLSSLALIALFVPRFIWIYLHSKAKNKHAYANDSVYNINKAILYYLNQHKFPTKNLSPAEFAYMIDSKFGTELSKFSVLYQKHKYNKIAVNKEEIEQMKNFYNPFITKIKSRISLKQRIKNFFNFSNTLNFYSKSKIN